MGRNQSIELLRIVACLGLIGYHAQAPGRELTNAGLMVFLVLTAYFESASTRPTNYGRLAVRLLGSWLIAMVAFGLISLVRGLPLLHSDNLVLGLLYGTSPHLWFLPFAFVCLSAIGFLKTRPRLLAVVCVSIATVAVITSPAWRGAQAPEPPWAQYLQALTPICIGALLGRIERVRYRILVVLVASVAALAVQTQGISIPYSLSLCAVMGAMLWPMPLSVQAVSRHTFGIYLIHPLFLMVGHGLHLQDWTVAVFAFCASLAALVAFDRIRQAPLAVRLMAKQTAG
jgi:surface polysaccharide O-acyltransferase-like enzyme